MQASKSEQSGNILAVLPPEIIVQILTYTDACSIGHFSASSSSCKGLVDNNSQIIYQAIANRQFNTEVPCTAGDSGITIESLPDFVLGGLESLNGCVDMTPAERQMRRAIKYQRTSSTCYDNVRTWKEFGRQHMFCPRLLHIAKACFRPQIRSQETNTGRSCLETRKTIALHCFQMSCFW